MSQEEIDEFENRLKIRLPDSFRQFACLTGKSYRHIFMGTDDTLLALDFSQDIPKYIAEEALSLIHI